MTLLELWFLCALLALAGYVLPALIVDRSLAMGFWTRAGLAIFMLLGPVGLALELVLLTVVSRDVLLAIREGKARRRCKGPAPSPGRE